MDDSDFHSISLADVFQAQAENKGANVLNHDWLDLKASDDAVSFINIKSFSPGSIYCGAVLQDAVMLTKRSFDIVPKMIRGGGMLVPSA